MMTPSWTNLHVTYCFITIIELCNKQRCFQWNNTCIYSIIFQNPSHCYFYLKKCSRTFHKHILKRLFLILFIYMKIYVFALKAVIGSRVPLSSLCTTQKHKKHIMLLPCAFKCKWELSHFMKHNKKRWKK